MSPSANLQVITSDHELSIFTGIAIGLEHVGHHALASLVRREIQFREDVNFTVHGYQKLIAEHEVAAKIVEWKDIPVS